MKSILTLLALATALFAQEERIILVPEKTQTPPPLFYSASAVVKAHATLERVTSNQDITFTIVQGKPEVLSQEIVVRALVPEEVRREPHVDIAKRN